MIVQFFPRINFVEGLAYSVNTTGALEIIPKPSGMGIFTRPTILSTHAVKDEFLTGEDEEYDTNGLQRMLTDQGFECVMIEHSLHGRYIQVGKQKRDGYTRYLKDYPNPPEWNPPRPWSCRIKGQYLKPLELCIPSPREQHTCYYGRTPPNAKGTKIIAPLSFSPRIEFQKVSAEDIISVNRKDCIREPGTLELFETDTHLQSLTFSSNLAIALDASILSRVFRAHWKTLADDLVDSSVADSKTLIPAPSSFKGRYWGMVFCLPFPTGVSYVGVKRDEEGRVVDWKKFEIGAFERYDGVGRLTNKGKTFTFPILTNDITAFKEWKDDTIEWAPGVRYYRTCRTECLFEWPVVVYTPSGGGSVVKNGKPRLADDQFEHTRPVFFVPLMVRFVPADGYHGPIDHKSGRRLCMGSAIFAFICSEDPSQYYTPTTELSLSMVQIRWPITGDPIFDEEFDLAIRGANYLAVPESQVGEGYLPDSNAWMSRITYHHDRLVRDLTPVATHRWAGQIMAELAARTHTSAINSAARWFGTGPEQFILPTELPVYIEKIDPDFAKYVDTLASSLNTLYDQAIWTRRTLLPYITDIRHIVFETGANKVNVMDKNGRPYDRAVAARVEPVLAVLNGAGLKLVVTSVLARGVEGYDPKHGMAVLFTLANAADPSAGMIRIISMMQQNPSVAVSVIQHHNHASTRILADHIRGPELEEIIYKIGSHEVRALPDVLWTKTRYKSYARYMEIRQDENWTGGG